jgi:hypothetical protein
MSEAQWKVSSLLRYMEEQEMKCSYVNDERNSRTKLHMK